MREGTSVPSDMSNTSSLFKYQGHDRVKTEKQKIMSYSDEAWKCRPLDILF